MASNRRRRSTAAGKSRSAATPPRKRRKIKAPSGSRRPAKKKAVRRPAGKIDIKGRLQKIAIVIFFIADAVLIYFFVRHCTVPRVMIEEPVAGQEELSEPVQQPIQIEVLNGCGVSGIAATFTDYLRDKGFDVVKTDNYVENGRVRYNVLNTVVIDRRGVIERAKQVAAALMLDDGSILSEPNEAYLVDATVLLGEDFKQMEVWNILERTYGE